MADPSLFERLAATDHARQVANDELQEVVSKALAKLPPRELDVLRRRVDEHQTETQIANELGVSRSVVSKLYTQAKRRLKRELSTNPLMEEILNAD